MYLSKRLLIDIIAEDLNKLDDDMRVMLVCVGKDAVKKYLKNYYTVKELKEMVNV